VANADDLSKDFIGKLIKIMKIEHSSPITLIEIQW